ncbi:MAG: hypothetical protein JWP59_4453 [Massilia sp.]|nr:hypothetical protein [Massilia sp.]
MPFHAGFDAAVYSGDASMAWLKAHSNLAWCGYYLSPAPNLLPAANSWRGRRAALAPAWGLAPCYVGQQARHGASAISAILTFIQGCTDGQQAVDNARRDGFARGTYLYLDWEDGGALSNDSQQYVSGWMVTVHARGFGAGLYCSHRLADSFAQLFARLDPKLAVRFWCWAVSSSAEHPLQETLDGLPRSDPAGCGYAPAMMWQREQNAYFVTPAGAPQAGQRIVIDVDTARLADPGAP